MAVTLGVAIPALIFAMTKVGALMWIEHARQDGVTSKMQVILLRSLRGLGRAFSLAACAHGWRKSLPPVGSRTPAVKQLSARRSAPTPFGD